MLISPRRRRRLDHWAAAALAVIVVVVAVLLYRSSDIRAASGSAAPSVADVSTAASVPDALTEKWRAATEPGLGAVVSTRGVVVTTDAHGLTGRDSATGTPRWTYTRSNRDLCAVGNRDLAPSAEGGVAAVYSMDGYCSAVEVFDSVTGRNTHTRTSPNQAGGSLVVGAAPDLTIAGESHTGWMGSSLVEVWGDTLTRSIQYGDQPNPNNPGNVLHGCTFDDMAVANLQFATVQHCNGATNARIVLNFDDPGAVGPSDLGWDTFKFKARMDVDTGSPAARIVGLTSDRVAVLVSAPRPAVVLYDAAGTQISRTPVDGIPAAEITDPVGARAVTPAACTADGRRISLIGHHLISVRYESVRGPAPATTIATTTPAATLGATASPTTAAEVDLASLTVEWTASDVLGLPAQIGGKVLIPVTGGLREADAAQGPDSASRTLPVDRGGYTGRVDAAAVGATVVETRGSTVVGLSGR